MIKLKLIYQHIKITMSVLVLVAMLISCTPSIVSSGKPLNPTIQIPQATAVSAKTTMPNESTPQATLSPLQSLPIVVIPTATIINTAVATSISTPIVSETPTVTVTPEPVRGELLIYGKQSPFEPAYIYTLSLETSEINYILKQEEEWQELRAWFSPTGTLVAYWIETADHSELWLTPRVPWSPKLVFTIPEKGFFTHYVEWLAGDQYLLFQLYNETSGIEPDSSYLINTANNQVISTPDWNGFCNMVAFSPRSNQISTWCLLENEPSIPLTYVVVEENGEHWLSHERPMQIVQERNIIGDEWAWSYDRQLFVYSDHAEPITLLHITNENSGTETHLTDEYSNYYSVVALSPDNRYLAYFGKCADGTFCQLIMEIKTKEVVWTDQKLAPSNSGGSSRLIWSPDSRYFALEVSPELLIIEVETGEVVKRFNDLDWATGVWLQDP